MKGVAFDLEGTCVDIETIHFAAYERALADVGIPMRAEDIASIPNAIGGGGSVIFAALSSSHPTLTELTLRESKRKYFRAMFEEAILIPREGLVEYIEHLLRGGSLVSIGSTTTRSFGEMILQKSGLKKYFKPEVCIFREDVAALKPAPEVYLRTAELMRVKPDEQIVFEDSIVGVEAGVAAGSTVIAVPVPLALSKERVAMLHAAGAQALYPDWTAVPRAVQ